MNHPRPHGLLRPRNLIAGLAAVLLALLAPAVASAAKDRNHDRIPDRWERSHGLSLKVNQAKKDQDRDLLNNRQEFTSGNDPHDDDSDGDGIEDGDESAGTITSFNPDTGELIIDVLNTAPVTGLVTDSTEIKCDNGDDQGDEDSDGRGGDDDGTTDQGNGDNRLARSGDDDPPGDDSTSEDPSDSDDETDESACTTIDLVPGAVVHQAELEDGTGNWGEIELLK